MQVNRKEFLAALMRAKPGLASKDRVEQASSFVFCDGKLVTYNEAVMVVAPCPLEGVEGAVRAEELLSLLNKLVNDTVDIAFKDGQMVLKAGRSRSGIRFEDEVRIPVDEVLDYYEEFASESNMPKGLLPAFVRAKFCVSKSMHDSRLTGIHFDAGAVTSTDNYRIFQTNVKGAGKLPEFLLPASAIDSLVPYKPTTVAITDKWAFFGNDEGILFCVRLLQPTVSTDANGDEVQTLFPDVSPVLNVKGPELILPTGILEALDKADVFTRTADHDSDRYVEITLKAGRVVVRGEGPFGWYEESVKAEDYGGDELTFSAHPDFLRDILPHVQTAVLGEHTVMFEGDDFVHVFALCAAPQGD